LTYLRQDWPNLNEKKMAYKYPNVAAELLSIPNEKILDFFANRPNLKQFGNTDNLLQFFEATDKRGIGYNYTRSGYICKILNSLILNRSGIFVGHILSQPNSIESIINSCHCKSVSVTILTLLTLIAPNAQTPMMLAAQQNIAERQNEMVTSNVVAEAIESTQAMRLNMFQNLINECINSSNDEQLIDFHNNSAWIIGQVLTKSTSERASFIQLFLANLDKLVVKLTECFDSSTFNRLGYLFLVIVEISAKEFDVTDPRPLFPKYFEMMFSLISTLVQTLKTKHELTKNNQITHTFSTEIQKVNCKIPKILEIINFSLKLYINHKPFLDQAIMNTHLEKYIFNLLTDSPFNNVIHNYVKKILVIIIEKGTSQLVDFYFAKNSEFYVFLDYFIQKKHQLKVQNKFIKLGFVGQTISIITAFKLRNTEETIQLNESKLIRFDLE